jgi:hypothetical protein
VRVNGVDVIPLVEAELNRRFPGRADRRAEDLDGLRAAWATLERVAAMPAGTLRRTRPRRDRDVTERVGRRVATAHTARQPHALAPDVTDIVDSPVSNSWSVAEVF